ncbi:hypothetical protein POM88_046425 [Heracleum sosnowskyi]|uniref:Uncharacterized protein n=1 Tax=Heracleum sosnowskyi TaxID=360622 RepID=A0AAD8M606_9APIA|nr:hypothetical protein POM88_046425 [Heracleum sosnowskyi]
MLSFIQPRSNKNKGLKVKVCGNCGIIVYLRWCLVDSVSVPQAIDVAIKELICVAKPSGTFLFFFQDVEFMATQVLTYGERKPVDQILDIVEEITSQDVSSVVGELITSPLTMASYGNVGSGVYYCSGLRPPPRPEPQVLPNQAFHPPLPDHQPPPPKN